ncbi:efflux RND transporter periplasmic adaptor subunit [Halofilum ochraceum]|uniref:efflux RND transporter periplasmic adaptor subunit n=1 Tax=Halofilum ochraceum TaxID=1611323 RepID=UPI0008DA1DB1|nr:efflux RND transporter periplasmic adaptor subunit [Halofilum ochraceum]
MLRRRHLVPAVLGLVVIGTVAWLLRPAPEPVSTATVERGPLTETIEEEGRTRVRERYDVSSPVAGWAPRVTLDPGDTVAAGEVLMALRPLPASALDPRARAEAEAALERARAALQAERARLEAARTSARYARATYERLAGLRIDGQVSRNEVERAEAEAERAEAEFESARYAVDVARQEVAAAEARLQYAGRSETPDEVPVEAPVDGQVLAVHHESQGVVAAGEPLLVLGNPASLEVVVEVLSADAVRIEPGMEVRFHRWGGEESLPGRVRRVEPSGFTEVSALGVEEQRVRVIAEITAPHSRWRGLGDAYRVEAEFILWSAEDVVQIPENALFETDDGYAVYVIADGIAQRRGVQIGHEGGLDVEIREGLSEGETVVLQPSRTITEGTRVMPIGQR